MFMGSICNVSAAYGMDSSLIGARKPVQYRSCTYVQKQNHKKHAQLTSPKILPVVIHADDEAIVLFPLGISFCADSLSFGYWK